MKLNSECGPPNRVGCLTPASHTLTPLGRKATVGFGPLFPLPPSPVPLPPSPLFVGHRRAGDLDAMNAPARLRRRAARGMRLGCASLLSHSRCHEWSRRRTSGHPQPFQLWWASKNGADHSLTSSKKLLSTTQKVDAVSSVKTACRARVVWSDVTSGGGRTRCPTARGGFHVGDARSASKFDVKPLVEFSTPTHKTAAGHNVIRFRKSCNENGKIFGTFG